MDSRAKIGWASGPLEGYLRSGKTTRIACPKKYLYRAEKAQKALIDVMYSTQANLSRGLSSIANQTALKQLNSQLSAAVQSALKSLGSSTSAVSGTSTASSLSSNSGSTGASSPSDKSASKATPAVGIGTTPVTTLTPLTTLGILEGGTVTVTAGGDTTTYASTGNDSVGDLIYALNRDFFGNARVTATLNRKGGLVITSKNTTDAITIGGVYASNIGFAVGHTTFQPAAPVSPPSSIPAGTSSSASAGSSGSAKIASVSSAKSAYIHATLTALHAGSAASFLSAAGVESSLVDMLA